MSMDTRTVDDFLNESSGSSYPGVAFPQIGAEVKGLIVSEPRLVDVTNDDGEVEQKMIVEIETIVDTWIGKKNNYTQVNGEVVALWVKKGWMRSAIRDAVADSGAGRIQKGGTLHVKHTEEGVAKKSTFNPPKLFKAKYVAPVANTGVDLDDL